MKVYSIGQEMSSPFLPALRLRSRPPLLIAPCTLYLLDSCAQRMIWSEYDNWEVDVSNHAVIGWWGLQAIFLRLVFFENSKVLDVSENTRNFLLPCHPFENISLTRLNELLIAGENIAVLIKYLNLEVSPFFLNNTRIPNRLIRQSQMGIVIAEKHYYHGLFLRGRI
jgi:hypothetical protein